MKRLKLIDKSEMPSLFDFADNTPQDLNTPALQNNPNKPTEPASHLTAEITKKKTAAAAKPQIQENFFNAAMKKLTNLAENNDMAGFLSLDYSKYDGINIDRYSSGYRTESDNVFTFYCGNRENGYHSHGADKPFNLLSAGKSHEDRYCFMVLAMDEEANTRVAKVTFTVTNHDLHEYSIRKNIVSDMAVGPWKPVEKLYENVLFMQPEDKLREILQNKRPWILPWLKEHNYSLKRYLSAPWLEILEKAGYAFVKNFLIEQKWFDKDIQLLNLLTAPGTKPKDIFKAPKSVYTVLKNETNMRTWDIFRKMTKMGKIGQDAVQQVYDAGYHEKDLEYVSSILGYKHNGKNVFSWTSLVNYLGRIDMYEAIDRRQGLPILNDYLNMCHQLEMEPRIDGDSLKREHDIAARLVRDRRDEIMAKKMKEAEEKLRREIAQGASKKEHLAYTEQVYTVRPIYDYDDLLDEARQQHNCVASYAERIAKGESIICTMRETKNPEKSLVTIELSPDMKTIRQKYLAYNNPIRSKSMSEFIDRWYRQIHAKAAVQEIANEAA